jgi:hypothetical protein
VWRIALRWTDAGWEVERRTRIDSMTLPVHPTDATGPAYELRGRDGAVLFRHRVTEPPHAAHLDDGSFVPIERSGDVRLQVLVPDIEGAVELHIGSELLPAAAAALRLEALGGETV